MPPAEPRSLTCYVAYHRSGPRPARGQRPYTAICNVGPDGSRPPGFDVYDDPGGWPEKNRAYCELSALRHLETHATTSHVGLVHYRRVFLARPPRARRGLLPGTYELARWEWGEAEDHGAGERDLLDAVGELDWCTPAPFDVRRAGFGSLAEQWAVNHPAELLLTADRAVARVAPGLPSLADHLRRRSATPLFNMVLARRELLVAYGRFLWPVLAACEADAESVGDGYQGRWAGFLAERLHGYWLEHVAGPQGVRTGTLPVGLLPGGAGAEASWLARTTTPRLPPALLLTAHRTKARLTGGLSRS